MQAWTGKLTIGGTVSEVQVTPDGRLHGGQGIEGLLLLAVRDKVDVMLTPTGPTVTVALDDPASIVAWLGEQFPGLEEIEPAPWDDPRTDLPEGAVG